MYNIHPILVHFPVALLFVYSVVKILPFQQWFPEVSWKHIERALLFVGVLGALAADATGDIAEHIARPNRQLVEMHSTFAGLTTFFFCVLLGGEIISIINASYKKYVPTGFVQKTLEVLENVICNRTVSVVVAILGFVAISVTGLLGGVMVYGLSADPIAGFVVHMLGITL